MQMSCAAPVADYSFVQAVQFFCGVRDGDFRFEAVFDYCGGGLLDIVPVGEVVDGIGK